MPTYDFKCPECDARTELLSAVADLDRAPLLCRQCGNNMKRVFTAPGLIFKGTGWAGKASNPPTTKEK